MGTILWERFLFSVRSESLWLENEEKVSKLRLSSSRHGMLCIVNARAMRPAVTKRFLTPFVLMKDPY